VFCPNCKSEYRDEFSECAECHAPLVAELPVEPEESDTPPQVVFTTANPLEANLIKSLLEANDVPSIVIDQHYPTLNLFITNALGGIKVCVPGDFVGKAQEVLEAYRKDAGDHPNFGQATPFASDRGGNTEADEPPTEEPNRLLEPKPTTCPGCQADVEADSNFCDQCGLAVS
jgi:hypothetical protein